MAACYKMRCISCEGKLNPNGITALPGLQSVANKYTCSECGTIWVVYSENLPHGKLNLSKND